MSGNGVVTIETNGQLLARVLGDVQGEQIPYATAKALTEVAFGGQRAAKSEMAHSLKLRNRFSQSGIQVEKADKADWPVVFAQVGVEQRRSYLIDHIEGGKRQGGTHGRAILEQDSLRSATGKVPMGKRPAALIAKARQAKRRADAAQAFTGKRPDKRLPFLFHSSKWGNEVLAQRTGSERYPLKIVYAFKRGVTIRREFEMDLAVERLVGASYYQAFERALRRAIATGKSASERAASRSRGTEVDTGR
jgi:hypothetical protein